MSDSMHETAATPSVSLTGVVTRTTLSTTLSMRQHLRPPFRWPQLQCTCVCFQKLPDTRYVFRQAKVYRCFGRIRFCDLTLKPRLVEHPHKRTYFVWEIDKIGYTRVVSEQNRVPFFSRRKIFHTTGKLPTVTTVMQPQQHC